MLKIHKGCGGIIRPKKPNDGMVIHLCDTCMKDVPKDEIRLLTDEEAIKDGGMTELHGTDDEENIHG